MLIFRRDKVVFVITRSLCGTVKVFSTMQATFLTDLRSRAPAALNSTGFPLWRRAWVASFVISA